MRMRQSGPSARHSGGWCASCGPSKRRQGSKGRQLVPGFAPTVVGQPGRDRRMLVDTHHIGCLGRVRRPLDRRWVSRGPVGAVGVAVNRQVGPPAPEESRHPPLGVAITVTKDVEQLGRVRYPAINHRLELARQPGWVSPQRAFEVKDVHVDLMAVRRERGGRLPCVAHKQEVGAHPNQLVRRVGVGVHAIGVRLHHRRHQGRVPRRLVVRCHMTGCDLNVAGLDRNVHAREDQECPNDEKSHLIMVGAEDD
mmetsp:Transcript_37221/g.97584  ORF Transcript_37221/g.97584 Transcript_37221/m.97584 type:complete len:252 (-) Transcript_37221:1190-1945(-)